MGRPDLIKSLAWRARIGISRVHYVSLDRLRGAYRVINPKAAPGVDGVTWEAYGQDLEENLRDLHHKVQARRYRASKSRGALSSAE